MAAHVWWLRAGSLRVSSSAERHVMLVCGNPKFLPGDIFTAAEYTSTAASADSTPTRETIDDSAPVVTLADVKTELQTSYGTLRHTLRIADGIEQELVDSDKAGVDVVCTSLKRVADVLIAYCAKYGLAEVHTSRLYNPWATTLDAQIAARLASSKISFVLHDDNYITPHASRMAAAADHVPNFEDFESVLLQSVLSEEHITTTPLCGSAVLSAVAESPSDSSTKTDANVQQLISLLQSDLPTEGSSSYNQLEDAVVRVATASLAKYIIAYHEMPHQKLSTYKLMVCFPPLIQSLVTSGSIPGKALWLAIHRITGAVTKCRGEEVLPEVGDVESAAVLHEWARGVNNNSSAPVSKHIISVLMHFIAEYCVGLRDWLALREYAALLACQKPSHIAVGVRRELQALPWCGNAEIITFDGENITFKHVGVDDALRSTFDKGRAVYAPVSGNPQLERLFWDGMTGYPLIDASITCLKASGSLPQPLLCLLQNYHTKTLGRSWYSGLHAFSRFVVADDVNVQSLQWQWNIGLLGDWANAHSFTSLNALSGHFSSSLQRRIISSHVSDAGGKLQEWRAWPRFHLSLPSHPHCLAHPAADEFAFAQDKHGLFVRQWLSLHHKKLSPSLPDAYIYQPHSAPAALLAGIGQTLQTTLSSDSTGEYVYLHPQIDLAESRQRSLDAVMSLMDAVLRVNPRSKEVSAAALHPKHAADTLVANYLKHRNDANYCVDWGCVHGWPLIVEEDVNILLLQENARKSDGWAQIVDDTELQLKVHMQNRSDSVIKTVMAGVCMPHFTPREVFTCIDDLDKYVRWDKTWQRVSPVGGALDPFNKVFYFLADSPPPPYSYLITQRDFVMFRHSFRHPFTGTGVNVLRNGAHHTTPPIKSFVRGETLGCVGFMVHPLRVLPHAGAGSDALITAEGDETEEKPGAKVILMTAADPKGSIPTYLINFVAKRTPRMWVERLSAACEQFYRAKTTSAATK